MFAVLLPAFFGIFFSDVGEGSSPIILWCKSVDGLFTPLFWYTIFSVFSFVAGFFNLGKKTESPLLWSMITEILTIVWLAAAILLLAKVFGDPNYMEYTNTFADAFLAIFGILVQVVLIIAIAVIGLITPAIHGITYTIRCLRVGIFEKAALPIIGLILMFFVPLVGSIVLVVYESDLKKKIASYEEY